RMRIAARCICVSKNLSVMRPRYSMAARAAIIVGLGSQNSAIGGKILKYGLYSERLLRAFSDAAQPRSRNHPAVLTGASSTAFSPAVRDNPCSLLRRRYRRWRGRED